MTRRLTGLDAAFLALETPTSTGHVGGLSILDPSTATEPLTLERLTAILASRLDAVPVLRQRLQSVPLGIDQPVWVDDRHFDIGYHVRELGLPSPGSDEQLAEQVSRIHARPLDRERPLWETYLLSGLAGGRMAVYTKVHHAAIDGVSGAEMLTLLFDLSPEAPTPGPAPEFRPQPGPGAARLGVQAIGRLAWRPVEVAKLAVNGVRAIPAVAPVVGPLVGNLLGLGRGPSGDGGVIKSSTPLVAPPTPLNVAISPHRRFAFASLPLDEVKFVKNTFEVSVNDVVMAISAGALRRWLLAHDALPDGPLVAMVPVSIRGADDAWEIFAFAHAELVARDTYRLSRLLRGLGGEEALAARTVAAGATVVLLDRAVAPLAAGLSSVGVTLDLRVGPAISGASDANYVSIPATATDKAFRPYAPVRPQARAAPAGIEISFLRRGRIDADLARVG